MPEAVKQFLVFASCTACACAYACDETSPLWCVSPQGQPISVGTNRDHNSFNVMLQERAQRDDANW